MPTAIDRRGLLFAAAAAALPGASQAAVPPTLFAAWDEADGTVHRVGLVRLAPRARTVAAIDVPTRAHGVVALPDGALLAVARRPGDWLLRWQPATRRAQWLWNEAGRVFNGHARVHAGGLYTTETDLASGQGLVVQRDLQTMQARAVWPTHGIDPHDLRFDPRDGTRDGALWVANGGIATDPATGRSKDTRAMDSSLVRLDAADGKLLGQWRLADRKLSLRHLALAADGAVGVALQAEHDDAVEREQAPLLARWQADRLDAVPGPAAAGYGGDITALGADLIVSAPRAGRVERWRAEQGWTTLQRAADACALVVDGQSLWCGAPQHWWRDSAADGAQAPGMRFDNHATMV